MRGFTALVFPALFTLAGCQYFELKITDGSGNEVTGEATVYVIFERSVSESTVQPGDLMELQGELSTGEGWSNRFSEVLNGVLEDGTQDTAWSVFRCVVPVNYLGDTDIHMSYVDTETGGEYTCDFTASDGEEYAVRGKHSMSRGSFGSSWLFSAGYDKCSFTEQEVLNGDTEYATHVWPASISYDSQHVSGDPRSETDACIW
jgi:hypothetical protein